MKIDELHNRLFELLCTVDKICRENDLTYFLDSGTEIGAVREKDYIPWDDDMDIKILAEDLPRFISVMEKELPSHLHIVTPQVFFPYFYDFVIRIYDDRYYLRNITEEDEAYNNYQNRVGTDVFLFSKAPNSRLLRKCLMIKSKILYGMAMAHRYSIDFGKYSMFQKAQVCVLIKIGKLFSVKKIYEKWYSMVTKWNDKQTNYRFASNYSLKSLAFFPSDLFEKADAGIIRGREFPVPIGYHDELTTRYGDYMSPPKNRDYFEKHLSEEDSYKEETVDEKI